MMKGRTGHPPRARKARAPREARLSNRTRGLGPSAGARRLRAEVGVMATVEREVPPLVPGDFLSRAEFLRRWEAMPEVKRAELIKGVVYMPPSPVSGEHGDTEFLVSTWLG